MFTILFTVLGVVSCLLLFAGACTLAADVIDSRASTDGGRETIRALVDRFKPVVGPSVKNSDRLSFARGALFGGAAGGVVVAVGLVVYAGA